MDLKNKNLKFIYTFRVFCRFRIFFFEKSSYRLIIGHFLMRQVVTLVEGPSGH